MRHATAEGAGKDEGKRPRRPGSEAGDMVACPQRFSHMNRAVLGRFHDCLRRTVCWVIEGEGVTRVGINHGHWPMWKPGETQSQGEVGEGWFSLAGSAVRHETS